MIPLRCAAFLAVLSLGAQAPDVAAVLARQTAPVLLILAGPEPGQARPLTSRELLDTDGLEEVRILSALANPNNPRGVASNRAYRAQLGLPEARWALVAPGGGAVASGTVHLDAAGLKAALEAARILTPIQQLQAFLRRHPDHLEAREKLLARLRASADQRTRLVLGDAAHRKPLPEARQVLVLRDALPKPGSVLTPEQDLRIWGATYVELGRAYKSGDWLEMNLPPDFPPVSQPTAFPVEAASPLMKGLFRAHRNKLLATLREVPEDLNVLNHWLWTSLVLEEPLIPVFESLKAPWKDPRSFMGGRSWPGEAVQRALTAEATANGDWTRLRRLLIARWIDGVDQRRSLRDARSTVSFDLDQWKEIGLPAVEACLRSGAPLDAGAVLDGAMEAKEAATFLEEAVSLAQRLGHSDTAQAWRAWRPKPYPPTRLWGMFTVLRSAKSPGRLQISRQRDSLDGPVTTSTTVFTIRMHPEDPQRSRQVDGWRRFLGWGPLDLRWAVLDPEGRILLQGFEPMDEKAVGKELTNMSLPDPLEEAKKIQDTARAQAAGNPWLRLEQAGADLQVFLFAAQQAEQMRRIAAEQKQASDPQFEKHLQDQLDPDQLRRMDPVLEEGLWKRAGWRPANLVYRVPGQLPVPSAEPSARRWAEALEDALLRKPTRADFWTLWVQWMKFLPERPILPLLDRLEPDPLARLAEPNSPWELGIAWPPDAALHAMTDQALSSGRWELLQKLLRSIWEEDLRSLEGPGLAGTSVRANLSFRIFHHSGLRLAYVHFKQGRPEEADKVLESALQAGLGSRQLAATMAAQSDFMELANYWNPPPKDPKGPPQQP